MRHRWFFLAACSVAACAGGQSKSSSADFAGIAGRAEELRAAGNTEKSQYAALLTDFTAYAKEHPESMGDAANRKLAQGLLQKYPPLVCPLTISEPAETLRTTGGFISPLVIAASCPAAAPFLFEADSADMALSPEDMVFSRGSMRARVRVNSATTSAEKNRLKFSAHYYAAEFISEVRTKFNLSEKTEITLNPAQYQLQAVPTEKDAYAEARTKFRQAKLTGSVQNGDLGSDVALSANGQFTVGGVFAGRKFDLLYGHPNSTLPDGIGTSFTTVRVDGTDYRLENLKGKVSKADGNALVYETKIGRTGISLRQIIRPETDAGRIKTRIQYEIRNSSAKPHSVGIRLLLDTWAGQNDGVPFLLPVGNTAQLYRTEVEFTPTASVMWQIFDIDRSTGTTQREPALQNILVGKDLVPPDRIAFANWLEASKTLWDYAVNSARRITGDSAVILWWQPATIGAGKTQQIATELGAYLERREPAVFVTNADAGEILIYLWHHNDTEATQKVAYNVRAEKGDLRFEVGIGDQALAPHKTFIKASPAQVLAEGGTTVIITETINGVPKEYSFPITNLQKWKKLMRTPVAEPAKQFPVSYFDERDMTVKARLVSAGGKTLLTIPLEKTTLEGGFEYKGNFEIPADAAAGRYTVEVVR